MFGDRFFKICIENAKSFYQEAAEGHEVKSYWYELNYKGKQSYMDGFSFQYMNDASSIDNCE